ncbi:MAG: AAA domain-containing protein [Anaerolineae bacterium]|nr:AAA domain-containing protein [Anaerolineae bacterium]
MQGECPPALQNLRVFEVTPARLMSGLGGMTQWLGRVNDFFNALAQSNAILFLRDFHTGRGLGKKDEEGSDFIEVISDLLQGVHPRLLFEARSRLMEVLNTEHGNLHDMLSPIQVNAMSKDDALRVTQKAAEDLEVIHEVHIAPEACTEAIELATRFQVNQLLPGSALDMLKDTLSTADTAQQVDGAVVRKRFTARSGLPDFLVSDDAPYDEADTRRLLTQRVFGQEAAVEAVLRTVALVRARLNNPIKPMGVFLFLGPTGVGKTELVKALAQIVFGGQERGDTRIVRFNMADYSNVYTAHERLFGDPYGRTEVLKQGELHRRLSSQPFTVLLLDEFEKAASNVYQSFMQMFDEGLMVNAVGDELNMRNSIIVLTSNLGARNLTHQIGFRVKDPIEQAEAEILKESEEYFKPEFINRLDAVCFFKPLSRPVIRQIAQREVQEVIAREGIARQQLRVGVDDSVIDLIVERGYDMRFGARYLKRVIERSITYPLARQIARKRLPPGALVRLVARGGDVAVGLIEEGEDSQEPRAKSQDQGHASITAMGRPIGNNLITNNPALKSMKELRAELDALKPRIKRMFEQHDIATLRERVSAMMDRIGDPDFWREPQEAAAQIETMNTLSQRVDQAENVSRLWDKCDAAVKHMIVLTDGMTPEAEFTELCREMQKDKNYRERGRGWVGCGPCAASQNCDRSGKANFTRPPTPARCHGFSWSRPAESRLP